MEYHPQAVRADVSHLQVLADSSHAYYSDEEAVIQCLADPRCVRPEDYVPAEDPEHRFDLTKIPEHEIGVMPAWRVFATSFVSIACY